MLFRVAYVAGVDPRREVGVGQRRVGPCVLPLLAVAGLFCAGLPMGAMPAQAACDVSPGCGTAPTNIGIFPGGLTSEAFAISNDGSTVVGYSGTGQTLGAIASFRWTPTGGMQNLSPSGAAENQATGVSADGSTIVGYAFFNGLNNGYHAYRWTGSGGAQDIGTLGGLNSQATAVSGDGLVVVGASSVTGSIAIDHAFRWTAADGMHDLGTLGGSFSAANATNADGSIVVGYASTVNLRSHAFRWTQAGGMTDLGTLGGANSAAGAITPDGTVIAGWAHASDNSQHLVRWRAGGSIEDLGVSPIGGVEAKGISNDGSVIVGNFGGVDRPFRWTQASGIRDINALMTAAGVDMTGITLRRANSVSGDGRFFVGTAAFPGSSQTAYIARYEDGPVTSTTPSGGAPRGPIAGLTNVPSVQASVDGLARGQRNAGVQQHGFSAPLLGGDKPMHHVSDFGAFGALGSASVGVAASYAFGGGFSVLGGLSWSKEEYDSVELSRATMGALALRYMLDGYGAWHPFVEAGGWIAPDAAFQFTRTYANGAGFASATSATHSDIGYVYGRVGVAFDIARNEQLVADVEYGHQSQRTDGYSETASSLNPFPVTRPSATDSSDLVKAKLQYTIGLTSRVDATLWAAVARSMNAQTGIVAGVDGIGGLVAAAPSGATYAQFGARVGYKLTEAVTLDAFTGGVAGSDGIEARLHSGLGLRLRF